MPGYYYNFLDIFNKAKSNVLPDYKIGINYQIKLEEGYYKDELGVNPLYRIILTELEEYRKYITENLEKGFIEVNSAL